MTDMDKIKAAMREVLMEHHCIVFPSPEEQVMARDLIQVGKKIKNAVILAITAFLLGGIGLSGYVAAKVDGLQHISKKE